MRNSKEDIKIAILIIASHLGLEDAYKELIKYVSLPELTKMIAYELFYNNVEQVHIRDNSLYNSIRLIRDYCIELQKVGFVTFDVPFSSDDYIKLRNK